MTSGCAALIEAMRPRQWVKNGVVFAGLVFGEKLREPHAAVIALGAFVIFCALSSSTYLFNDLCDAERDRQHPLKRNRPIASGRLSPAVALAVASVLVMAGLAASALVSRPFFFLATCYVLLGIFYSRWLKAVPILDVFAVAAGFVIRAAAGAEAVNVAVSPWLLVCTMLLSLFLTLSKRRHELVLMTDQAVAHRAALSHYTPYLLDQMISVVTASTVVCYCLYALWPETVEKFHTHNLVYTVPFVLFGIYRYLYLVHRAEQGDQPDKVLLTDIPMLVDVALWLAAVVLIIYL
jgi:4-hydroxybenzoate polyprenyltransferase